MFGRRETTIARIRERFSHAGTQPVAWSHGHHPSRPRGIGSRFRRDRPRRSRPHPLRHHQLRGGQGEAGGRGRRVRGRLPPRPRTRAGAHRLGPGAHERRRARGGTHRGQACSRGARTPRRGAGGSRELVGRPLRRGDPRRHAVGARGRGHEEHGCHDPDGDGRPPPERRGAREGSRARLLRRRGERGSVRLAAHREDAPGALRGRHGGHQRGGRLLDHDRGSACVPDADG
jgi:hypothetical protein